MIIKFVLLGIVLLLVESLVLLPLFITHSFLTIPIILLSGPVFLGVNKRMVTGITLLSLISEAVYALPIGSLSLPVLAIFLGYTWISRFFDVQAFERRNLTLTRFIGGLMVSATLSLIFWLTYSGLHGLSLTGVLEGLLIFINPTILMFHLIGLASLGTLVHFLRTFRNYLAESKT